MVASDLSTLQFYADQYFDISVWRSNIALPLDFHFVQKGFWSFKLAIYTCFCNIRPWFCAKGRRHATEKLAFRHTFARPTCAISAEGCQAPTKRQISPQVRASNAHDPRTGLLSPRQIHISPHVRASDTHAEGSSSTNRLGMPPHVCASDTHDLPRGSHFVTCRLATLPPNQRT